MSNNEITQEMIGEWKSKYGEIYSINLSEKTYVYRPLKRLEYKSIVSNADTNRSYSEEQIVQKCLIYPGADTFDVSAEKAGTVSTLTDLIMVASNFGVTEEPVKL